jgi:hypothetical protein
MGSRIETRAMGPTGFTTCTAPHLGGAHAVALAQVRLRDGCHARDATVLFVVRRGVQRRESVCV